MSDGQNPTELRLEVQKLNELPAMSLVVHQFLQALQDNDVEFRQLGQIIEKDPALMARIIGLANSAYFGCPEPINTAEDAIYKVLGLNTAKSLALAIVLGGPFDGHRCPVFHLDDYWVTAMATAMLAQRLARFAKQEPRPGGGEAYLAGLLHDLGALPLVHLYPEEMTRVCHAWDKSPELPLREVERQVLGADRHHVGGWLARKWHLPDSTVAVMEHYFEEDYSGEHWPLVRLIGFAVRWARDYRLAEEEIDCAPLEALGIPLERAQMVIEDFRAKQDEVETMAHVISRG